MLIAIGAILPAFGGAFSRLGIPKALYLSELSGAVLMFIGFTRATTPMQNADDVSSTRPTAPTGGYL